MIQLVGFFKCNCDNTALRLCSTVKQCFLLPSIPPHFTNSFFFSIFFFLGLLQPPSPLFIAFLRLSSLPTTSMWSSWSCKHSVSRGRVLVPRSHSHVVSMESGTFSPQAPGGFKGHNHSELAASLYTWQRTILVLRFTGLPGTSVAAEVCHHRRWAAAVGGTRGSQLQGLIFSRGRSPYVTYLSKEKDDYGDVV